MGTSEHDPVSTALRAGIVISTTEELCTVAVDGTPIEVGYAEFFPTPRVERVRPGHLVALDAGAAGRTVVVWRWFDAVVQDAAGASVRLWEPAHGSVLARPRTGSHEYVVGSRAYLSAGLPGAQWWVAGPVVGAAEDADVDFAEVRAFLDELGLGVT